MDLYQRGRGYMLRTSRLSPTIVDTEGSDANIIAGSTAEMGAAVMGQLGQRTSALLLDGCETDDDLDRYAFDRYQLVRKGASPAKVPCRVFRQSFAAGGGSVPIGTLITTTDGGSWITTSVANFGASDLVSRCNARAQQAGAATRISAGGISRFTKPATLFDPSLQIANDVDSAGGEDKETFDLFKERVRGFWRTARKGILSAIEFGAKSVPGVVSARAIEELTPGGLPARVVNLYIADSSGVANEALALDVASALDDFRAGGIAVIISTSIPLIVDIQLRLVFRANVDTVTLGDNVRAAVVSFINSLPVNGTLYRQQLGSVLQRYASDGLVPKDSGIVSPVGDLVPAIGQTIRTTTGNVSLLT